jgi:tryptophanyl-tRNA synthetase
MAMTKPVILTGLRANNDLTIGNYFGAMLPVIEMAQQHAADYQINMFIPDLHSFTTPIDHDQLQGQIMNNAKLYTAAGLPLDSDSILLYRQSYVPAHSELTWILDCFTGVGEMGRMIEYKDKSAKIGDDRVSVGLFNYPVLMAADILLYGAEYVPVGEDQRQHLEFARDISGRINGQFGEIFTVPHSLEKQTEFFNKGQGLRIKDLQDPNRKMSKSDDSGKGVIFLSDSPEVAAKKVMSAATDDKANVNYDPIEQPGISNLLQILALLRTQPLDAVEQEFKGQERYGDFKRVVADEVSTFLTDFQSKLAGIDDVSIHAAFERSEKTANEQANATLLRVQQAVGLRPRA